jgi:hypothetical protein
MDAQDGGVGFGVGRQTVEIEELPSRYQERRDRYRE